MAADIEAYVASCSVCQQHARSQQKERLLQKVDSYAIKQFAKQWSFVHTTSSPRYSHYNGFAERTVQTVKNTIRKAKMDELDPELALLCLHTTLISEKIRSPIEMLMGRKAKANLPISMRNQLADSEQINAALRDRQVSQKSNYDSRAGAELP